MAASYEHGKNLVLRKERDFSYQLTECYLLKDLAKRNYIRTEIWKISWRKWSKNVSEYCTGILFFGVKKSTTYTTQDFPSTETEPRRH